MSDTQENSLDSLLQQGIQLDRSGRHDAAEELYRQILGRNPRHAYALYLLGTTAMRRGELDVALELISAAIQAENNEPVFHLFLGKAFQEKGDLIDALAAYDHVLSLEPRFQTALYRRATVLLELQEVEQAISGFKQSLAVDSTLAEAALVQAREYRDAGKQEVAIILLRIIIQYHPQKQEAYSELGFMLLAQDLYSEARQVFLQLFFLGRGSGWKGKPFLEKASETDAESEPVCVSTFFLENLIGHIEYLVAGGKLHTSFLALAGIYRDILDERACTADLYGLITLTPDQAGRVRTVMPRALYYSDSAPVQGKAVNPALDGKAIQQDYLDSPWRMTWFDDFLSVEALQSLRDFCLESTIFFRTSHNSFVSSYLQEGFNCSVLFQMASELKQKFPDLLAPLELQNMWCYRQSPEGDGVRAHSDQSEITFNFWISADDANLDKEHGGLVLYDKEQPLDWDWYKINSEKDNPEVLGRIMDYLEDSKIITIPYRENRAVMFYSNMFHRSDRFRFKAGYENSRMNITMLFGRHPNQLHK